MAGSNNANRGGNEVTDGNGNKAPDAPRIEWHDAEMTTSYANICNVAGTGEEVSLFFGTNVSWKGGKNAVQVRLDNRLLLTPFTAKRLHLLIANFCVFPGRLICFTDHVIQVGNLTREHGLRIDNILRL